MAHYLNFDFNAKITRTARTKKDTKGQVFISAGKKPTNSIINNSSDSLRPLQNIPINIISEWNSTNLAVSRSFFGRFPLARLADFTSSIY